MRLAKRSFCPWSCQFFVCWGMEGAKPRRLPAEEAHHLLTQWVADPPGDHLRADPKKHSWQVFDATGEIVESLKLPLPWPAVSIEEPLEAYLDRIPEDFPTYVLFLMQMGAAAVGVFEEGEAIEHKAIKKYMKRHSRGKAQISYLNTRGKSKAGSRVRLANTVRFFEEINEYLTEWVEWHEPERIIYSGTPQLWGLLFQSSIAPPFDKKDERIIKVPYQVHVPDYEELLRVNELIGKGQWVRHT